MGGGISMTCFPRDDDPTEEDKDKQTEEQTTTDKGTEPTEPATAGDSQKPKEGVSSPKLTKLDRKLVDSVWDEVRGNAEKPTEEFIRKSIKKDDFDGSGVLEKSECKRMCESFQLRAKKNGDVFESWEHVFDFLDKNGDDTLDFEDIKYTITVMWLMTKNHVSLQRVNAVEPAAEAPAAPSKV